MKIRNTALSFMLAVGLMLTFGFESARAQAGDSAKASSSSAKIEYSEASLQGRYAFVNQVGSIASSFGTLTFDGSGNILDGSATGNTIIRNAAGRLDSMVFPFPFTGSYTLNGDGLGTATFIATLPNGATKTSVFDMVVTEVEKINGRWTVTELRAFSRERDPNTGAFGQVICKRLSDK